MQVESLVSVSFAEEELKEALLMMLECEMNDTVYGTPEHTSKKQIIEHIRNETCSMDWVNGRFVLSADGICTNKPF